MKKKARSGVPPGNVEIDIRSAVAGAISARGSDVNVQNRLSRRDVSEENKRFIVLETELSLSPIVIARMRELYEIGLSAGLFYRITDETAARACAFVASAEKGEPIRLFFANGGDDVDTDNPQIRKLRITTQKLRAHLRAEYGIDVKGNWVPEDYLPKASRDLKMGEEFEDKVRQLLKIISHKHLADNKYASVRCAAAIYLVAMLVNAPITSQAIFTKTRIQITTISTAAREISNGLGIDINSGWAQIEQMS